MTGSEFAFRVLSSLPPGAQPPQRFVSGSKVAAAEGLMLEIKYGETESWIANFHGGFSPYSNVAPHPNGRDVVVVARGAGYVIRPADRTLITTFGNGIRGVWPIPKFNLLLIDDAGVSLAALSADGWLWKTPQISSGGFEGIEIAEKTIYGRGWNAVQQRWHPFSIDIASGSGRGGVPFESTLQRAAIAREMTLRGGAPLHPLVKRTAEVVLGLFAVALVILTIYLAIDSVRTGELTYSAVRDNWGLAYAGLFLTAVVAVLGVRLVFPSLAPRGRLLSKSGLFAFFGLYLASLFIVYLDTGVIPLFVLAGVGFAVGKIAINKWFS